MRRTIMLVHSYVAAFVAPVFVLLAISGGLYLLGDKGSVTKTALELPAGATLDFESATLKDDVSALLEGQGVNHRFEYMRGNKTMAMTRPTSRTYYEFALKDGELTANRVEPNFQKRLIELHKGHGPMVFRNYQKLVALSLIISVLSGLWVGIASPVLRKQTLISLGAGFAAFILLAFVV